MIEDKIKICGIYKIISPSGRIYIGQSIDCLHRSNEYRLSRCKKQPKLLASILKYGWDNHLYEIIHRCEENQLNGLEKYYSELYNSCDSKVGLNIRECGGSRGRHSKESIEKCSIAKIGKKKSAEHLAKIVATRKRMFAEGQLIPWNKGLKGVQKSTEQSRGKQRAKMIGLKRPESHKLNCRLRFKREVHPLARLVLNTENGIFYDSAREVANVYGLNYQVLVNKLAGRATNKTQFIFV